MNSNSIHYADEDAEYVKQIGERIRRVREKRGLNQSDLAGITNTTQATISQIEQGHRKQVKVSRLAAIAKALDTPMDYLLTGDEVRLHFDHISTGLSDVLERLATFTDSQQDEISDAIQWLMEWRYSALILGKEGQ